MLLQHKDNACAQLRIGELGPGRRCGWVWPLDPLRCWESPASGIPVYEDKASPSDVVTHPLDSRSTSDRSEAPGGRAPAPRSLGIHVEVPRTGVVRVVVELTPRTAAAEASGTVRGSVRTEGSPTSSPDAPAARGAATRGRRRRPRWRRRRAARAWDRPWSWVIRTRRWVGRRAHPRSDLGVPKSAAFGSERSSRRSVSRACDVLDGSVGARQFALLSAGAGVRPSARAAGLSSFPKLTAGVGGECFEDVGTSSS